VDVFALEKVSGTDGVINVHCQREIPVEGIDLAPASHWRHARFLSARFTALWRQTRLSD
jgi:hypothetical protein